MEHVTALVDHDATPDPSFADQHLRDFCTDAEAAETAAFMRAQLAERGLAKRCACQRLVAAGWKVTCRACGRGASTPDAIIINDYDVVLLVATATDDVVGPDEDPAYGELVADAGAEAA
jgi:hypothetical protein